MTSHRLFTVAGQPARWLRARALWMMFATLFAAGLGPAGMTAKLRGAEEAKTKAYDIPAGDAISALKQFSVQSGEQLLYSSEEVAGVSTQAVQGQITAQNALDQMLAGTGLVASHEINGAYAIRRKDHASGGSSAPGGPGSTAVPTRADVGAGTAPEKSGVVEMSPYEVNTTPDQGYSALNSNNVLGFNAELNKMPLSADILDQQFMSDIGTNSLEAAMFGFSAGSGVNTQGASGNASSNQPGDRNGSAIFMLRGLNAPNLSLNGILPQGSPNTQSTSSTNFSSTFSIEKVEILNGPQSLLYGDGGAGGVINMVTKQAQFNQPSFGSLEFQVDQYGNKLAQLDYGMGTDDLAVRIALINQTVGYRRLNIGGPMKGLYGQIAAAIFKNTVLRVDLTRTDVDQFDYTTSPSLVAASTANDARNGQPIVYLLASNQMNIAANGAPSGAGVIDNGFVNWGNAYSFGGYDASNLSIDSLATGSLDTKWNSWLSTQISGGYKSYPYFRSTWSPSLYAPNATANPFPGQWAAGSTTALGQGDTDETVRAKAGRVSAVITNDLFHGFAHSETSVGVDYNRVNNVYNNYGYFQADSNWNVLYNSAATLFQNRTVMPNYFFPVPSGPITYGPVPPRNNRIVINGVNYVRMLEQPVNAALINLNNNPEGVAPFGTTYDYETEETINNGYYGVNYTAWDDGKLTTLAGIRLSRDYSNYLQQNVLVPWNSKGTASTVSFGANYAVTSMIRPYLEASSSYDPPTNLNGDPYGKGPPSSKAVGEEIGVKIQNPSGTISGSIAAYSTQSKNEELSISTSLLADINPSGLNGVYSAPSEGVTSDRKTRGVQLTFTALPTPNWRMRLSAAFADGTTGTSTSYAQLYNDQFHENSSGQVTYADGTVVYVNPTYNSAQKTVPSTTAGAIPLTVTAMSTPGNAYFAAPLQFSGQIPSSTNVYKVLQTIDPTHGAILTGVTGLPISQIQINTALAGVQIPGTIITSNAGDPTYGYPELSMNFVNVYTFSTGWLKGVRVGETVQSSWKNRGFLYYPNGFGLNAQDTMFEFPTEFLFGGILGYSHKFGRLTFDSQLNVSNMFNHYHAVLIPNILTGFSNPTAAFSATFDQQPRMYTWTNTIRF